MARIVTYECEQCGSEIIVTETGETRMSPIYCCDITVSEVNSVQKKQAKPKKAVKKAVAKKTVAKKAVKKPAAKKAVKKTVAKKTVTKSAAKKKAPARKKS